MKMYVKLFPQAEPAVFKLYDNQIKLFWDFLEKFIKPEDLN